MMKTIEAVVDKRGRVRLLEKVKLRTPQRALVTILDDSSPERVAETALLSQKALSADWDRPEEDEAWSHLQVEP